MCFSPPPPLPENKVVTQKFKIFRSKNFMSTFKKISKTKGLKIVAVLVLLIVIHREFVILVLMSNYDEATSQPQGLYSRSSSIVLQGATRRHFFGHQILNIPLIGRPSGQHNIANDMATRSRARSISPPDRGRDRGQDQGQDRNHI